MKFKELLLINKKRLFCFFTTICAVVSLVGCYDGGEFTGASPAVVPSSTESGTESNVRSSIQSSLENVSTSAESSSDSTVSSDVSQVTELIEEPNVLHLIRDPQNEVNIHLDGDKITIFGKDTDIKIEWILLGDDGGAPQKTSDEFTITLSAPESGTSELKFYTKSDIYDYSYPLKFGSGKVEIDAPEGTVERNLAVTENPHVTAAWRYITVDGGDVNVILTKIRKLSDEICEGLDSDYDKLRAISRWVADNLYFDFPARNAGIPSGCLTLEYMLDKRASVCVGYANMTSALAQAQKIKCYNVKSRSAQGAAAVSIYHEFNFAVIDGRVVWLDPGWDSHNFLHSGSKYEHGESGIKYFDIGIEALSSNHICVSAEYRDFYGLLEG